MCLLAECIVSVKDWCCVNILYFAFAFALADYVATTISCMQLSVMTTDTSICACTKTNGTAICLSQIVRAFFGIDHLLCCLNILACMNSNFSCFFYIYQKNRFANLKESVPFARAQLGFGTLGTEDFCVEGRDRKRSIVRCLCWVKGPRKDQRTNLLQFEGYLMSCH